MLSLHEKPSRCLSTITLLSTAILLSHTNQGLAMNHGRWLRHTFLKGHNYNYRRAFLPSKSLSTVSLSYTPSNTAMPTVNMAQRPQRFSTASNISNGNTSRTYYESYGDYKIDATELEDPSLPLYSAQEHLPRLPVPSLEETCQRFLPTALPLASTEAEAQSLLEAADKFPHQAKELQRRLLQRTHDNPNSSWLQEWWNTLGYLQVRDPIVVHVSYFFRCDDDPVLERLLQQQETETKSAACPPYQPCLLRSAALLPAAIRYVQTIRTNETEPQTLGKGKQPVTLCSTQMKYMFHACRIPQHHHDTYRLYFPTKEQEHVVIAVRGQFFAIGIPANGEISQHQWRRILQHCIDSTTAQSSSQTPPSMGWLTGMGRDEWAAARNILLEQGGEAMAQALEWLESSMFVLCMDIDETIGSDRERALQFWHGRSNNESNQYHNRWYDKSAAVLVTQNGKLGFQGEHSMLDGMPFVDFCDTIVREGTVTEDCFNNSHEESSELPTITNIFEQAFEFLSPEAKAKIEECIQQARCDLTTLVNDYELDAQHYHKYGSTIMKKAGCSPDAYIQMAMQLASYRMFREPLATYESTQVRRFLHGRTETTRTVSPASVEFCQAMDTDSNTTRKERYDLLQQACFSHVQYIRNAIQGQGVDRHFFGLSMLAEDDNEAIPDLFSHPLFKKSKRFQLSTSSLVNMAVGFGPVTPDGFGIGYEAKRDTCIFHITARKEHQGWTEQMCELLGEALDDMRTLYDVEDEAPRSRL